ncbi:IS1595 family transposase [Dyadobacter jiangsuensis]
MEKAFKSLSLIEFQSKFPNDQACMDYLAVLKWPNGYSCEKCGHNKYCQGKLPQSRQCTKCGYQATPTSGTLFHKVKFSLQKAFYIIYFMSTNKKGISSTELSRKLGLRQKTCWMFRKKVAQAMKSSKSRLLQGSVEVDEMLVGQQEEGVKGRKKGNKKLLVVAIERKGRGIGRMYAREIDSASRKHIIPFFEDFIAKKARVRTDKWSSYKSIQKQYPNLKQEKTGPKGKNFTDMHRIIMGFKLWLRGMHHSVMHLQDYLDEYTYRFNRSYMKGNIFDNLLQRLVKHPPFPITSKNLLYA